MSSNGSIRIGSTGLVWGAGSMIFGEADIIIPIDQLGELSNAEIGEWVRLMVPRAFEQMAWELIDNHGIEGILKHYDQEQFEKLAGDIALYGDENLRYTAVLSTVAKEGLKKYRQKTGAKKAEKHNTGWVYLAYSETGHYKIGISKDPNGRIKVFDTQMPVEVRIVHRFKADNYRAAEATLHDKFKDKHHTGEWFNLNINDCNYIRSIQSFSNGSFNHKGE